VSAWAFDPSRLRDLADRHGLEYRSAEPFAHVVIDGMFPDALLDEVSAAFPPGGETGWRRSDNTRQRKLEWSDVATLPPAPAYFVGLLQSTAFVQFLERLTGITGLIGDPHCLHAGLHQIESGGYLQIHSDQSFQDHLRLYRRVDVIVYLNRDWSEDWGGQLELWDATMTRRCQQISPLFNRTVIFAALPTSNHGHPEPMRSPVGVSRRSVAQYYYTSPGNGLFPQTAPQRAHFRATPGGRSTWRSVVVDVTPPALLRQLRRLRPPR
jgi:hypothetical protein